MRRIKTDSSENPGNVQAGDNPGGVLDGDVQAGTWIRSLGGAAAGLRLQTGRCGNRMRTLMAR